MEKITGPLEHRNTLTPPGLIKFTRRELEIVMLLCCGFTQPAVAKHLMISEHTVKTHVERMRRRTGTDNTLALVVYLAAFRFIDVATLKGYLHVRLTAQAREELDDAA